jgi:lipoprotein-releasing system ATP-binding protein
VSLLSLSGVSKRYDEPGGEIEVLSGLDLEIYGGELVGIWSSPGAGRTTLARIAAGLEAPSAGTVSYAGRDLARLTLEDRVQQWRHGIAFVSGEGPAEEQTTACSYVAEPLLGLEPRAQAYEEASKVLTNVGLGDDAVDERWADLRDGERALAAIARAILRLPRLIVLDDLTEPLHFDDCEHIMNVLRSLAENIFCGVLMTTPEMADLLYMDRFCWLSDGRLMEPRPSRGPRAVAES